MLNIELKEDSSEKLASVNGKPTRYYLFAEELNQIVQAINLLANSNVFTEWVNYVPPQITGVDFIIEPDLEWKIKGVSYSNPEEIGYEINLADTGMKKFILFYANQSNTIVRLEGDESVNPPVPQLPPNTILYSLILVSDTAISSPSGPSTVASTPQKTVVSNKTLDNSFNGAIVKVKANATITIPNTLTTDFSCVFRCFTGATATFVGSGVTMDAPKGLILEPFKMATLFKDGSTSTFVLEGELKT